MTGSCGMEKHTLKSGGIAVVEMEYCPEIAVLQSAFQLVSKKAGQTLPDLPKDQCNSCVEIIATSVDEICTGLVCDFDSEERLLWQQKIHTALLYVLVMKKYKKNEECQQEGQVPVCSVLDMLTELLPLYSYSFYFELMKRCNWAELFLQSLQCLDYQTSSTLLDNLITHCHSNPVTEEDTFVITMVTNKLLSRCLCVPDNPCEICVNLLGPLTQSRRYVQTVFPEESKVENVIIVGEEAKRKSEFHRHGKLDISRDKVGVGFWNVYCEKNPQIFDTVLVHFEFSLENMNKSKDKQIDCCTELMETVAQLGTWLYIVRVGTDDDISDYWFIDNLYIPSDEWKPESNDTAELVYSLNFTLSQSLKGHVSEGRLIACLTQALSLISEQLDLDTGSERYEESVRHNEFGEIVKVVAGLAVDMAVLIRMLGGMLGTTDYVAEETVEELGQILLKMAGIVEQKREIDDVGLELKGQVADVGVELKAEIADVGVELKAEVADVGVELKGEVDDVGVELIGEVDGVGVIVGEIWCNDLTLEAVLWRIDNKLPQFQVCVDRLLNDRCLQFWTLERLYLTMNKHASLLSRTNRVLALTRILAALQGYNSRQTTPLLNLVRDAFSELSFPDQDFVVMEMYCRGDDYVSKFFKEGLERKVTNVFNKLTADLDNQVLSEVILLCLGDPVLVLASAVDMCVSNEQQALNCSLIARHLSKTCRSRHPVHHSDKSLMAVIIQDFLKLQTLSEKEQKCFGIFVSELMQPAANTSSKGSVLSPTEFLHTSVLPCVSVQNMCHSNFTMTCKFAASLLLSALESGCNKSCDWLEFEFEPMALVLSLVEIKHECVVLWDIKDLIGSLSKEENTPVAVDTGSKKLALKEVVNRCLDKLIQMLHEGFIHVQQSDVRWLLEVTSGLHWTVKLGLCPFLGACGWAQYRDEWLSTLDGLVEDLGIHLVAVLQCVATDRYLIQHMLDNIRIDTDITSRELIHSLIQVLPQSPIEEFDNIVKFVEGLQSRETVHVSMIYRFRSTCNMPLLDFTEVRPALYTSLLLSDVIVAIAMTLPTTEEAWSMLHHTVHCYISVIKTRCDQAIHKDLLLIYLGELFHHVCEVTLHLPTEIMDTALVLLLHILTKFKDVAKAISKRENVNVKSDLAGLKMKKNIENGMYCVVQRLPEICEEKHMLLKKLSNQSV